LVTRLSLVTDPPDIPASGPVDLDALADELLARAATENSQRASRTLPHPVEGLRQTAIALLEGSELGEHNSPGPAALLVLRGRAILRTAEADVELDRQAHIAIPPGRHSLHAVTDTVVLLTVALTVLPPPAGSGLG
jgi:quercetin dioxygenase-like cupin family protein